MSSPVLFLAFANDPDEHLELLKTESKEVFSALRDLDRREFVRVHREESLASDDLYETLLSFKDQVGIFHYAGHANGQRLRLEDQAGHAGGIARLLGEQSNVKLVFLNGCATADQVDQLFAAGVPAVIATSVVIRDDAATEFSIRFYQALANRRTIEQAFALAAGFLETKYGAAKAASIVSYRSLDFDDDADDGGELPWALYVKEERRDEVLNWRLPYYRPIGLPQDMVQHINNSFKANRYVMLVLDEMAKYNPDIYTQMMETRDGELVKRDSSEYPELVIKNFPWPVGSQVRLLRHHDAPGPERLEQLVSTYCRTSQLLYYILLSDLWEHHKAGTMVLPEGLDLGLPLDEAGFRGFDFLEKAMELCAVFEDQDVPTYVPEFERFAAAWRDPDGPLQKVHRHFEGLKNEVMAEVPEGDPEHVCLYAEQAISVLLGAAAFLARYRMLTVRNVSVEAPRFEQVAYELDVGPLNAGQGGDLSLYDDREKRRKTAYGNSHSVVLVRDEECLDQALNLSPFIVDKNTYVGTRRSDSTDVAHIFVLSFEDDGRLVYLAVDHCVRVALESEGDQIHTNMTRGDFSEGRNLTHSATADPFGLGLDSGLLGPTDPRDAEKVFEVLEDQFNGFLADVGASR